MAYRGIVRKAACSALAVTALTFGITALSVSNATSSGASTSSTATWAEAPQTPPNFIFPFMSLAFFGVQNSDQFQYLMYRPLYWFGQGTTPNLNESLSLAYPPVYSNNNTTVTVDLKSYKWSDGESLTPQDVMFWMNMLHSEKANWAAYVPGGANIPDNVKSITISGNKLIFQLTQAFNTYWYTYNQLAQITPLPVAWDKTSTSGAAGSGGCSSAAYGTADAACAAVYTFLSDQAGYNPNNPKAANNSLSTYATNPLWQVVDGPWHLTSFDSSGNVTMAPNKTYSGPIKPTIKKFVELPFTSDSAEFNALVGGKVNVGFVPQQDLTASTDNPLKTAANNPRLTNFTLAPLYLWGINYYPYNFDSTGDNGAAGKIFNQLYFRQAYQLSIDQPLYIKKILHGYAVPTYGPVPVLPANTFASSTEKSNPYAYNPSKAKQLLTSHGWKVTANGTDTCHKPGTATGDCGAGIPSGAKLAFNIQYVGGTEYIEEIMNAEKSSLSQVGINVSLSTASFPTVIGNATPCPTGCSWQIENWGGGWTYNPDFYPTGEDIFSTGAGSNSGNYSNPTNDSLIKQTNDSDVSLTQYENYLAKQVPVAWQPDPASELTEIQHGLEGVTPQNVLWNIEPENWHWKS